MKSWMAIFTISAALVAAAGCCSCQHPYDTCGPVYSRGECANCSPDYRSGSALNRQGTATLAADRSRMPATRVAKKRAAKPKTGAPQVATMRPTPAGRPTLARPIALESPHVVKLDPVLARPVEPTSDQKASEEAAFAAKLPAGTVMAPPGTREGSTKVLSVTDKRLDEAPSAVADRKEVEPFAEQPTAHTEEWHAAPRRRSYETTRLPTTDR